MNMMRTPLACTLVLAGLAAAGPGATETSSPGAPVIELSDLIAAVLPPAETKRLDWTYDPGAPVNWASKGMTDGPCASCGYREGYAYVQLNGRPWATPEWKPPTAVSILWKVGMSNVGRDAERGPDAFTIEPVGGADCGLSPSPCRFEAADVLRRGKLKARPVCRGASGRSRYFSLSAPGRERAIMAVTQPFTNNAATVVRLRIFWGGPIDCGALEGELP